MAPIQTSSMPRERAGNARSSPETYPAEYTTSPQYHEAADPYGTGTYPTVEKSYHKVSSYSTNTGDRDGYNIINLRNVALTYTSSIFRERVINIESHNGCIMGSLEHFHHGPQPIGLHSLGPRGPKFTL